MARYPLTAGLRGASPAAPRDTPRRRGLGSL